MSIARDYLLPTDTQDASETQLVDRLLVGWGAWARNDGIDLRPVAFGDLWQIQAIIEAREYVLQLTDDAFTYVDQHVAVLPRRLRVTVFCEYLEDGPPGEKPRRLGLSRIAYRQRLHAAQWALFTSLLPALDGWRQKSVNSAHP
jgi:hypothetical protein